jgi:hypothetical protein
MMPVSGSIQKNSPSSAPTPQPFACELVVGVGVVAVPGALGLEWDARRAACMACMDRGGNEGARR